MNKYPLWKNLLILITVVLGIIYALPNIYPPDPAIQISHESGVVDQSALDTATAVLRADGINILRTEIENGNALIRLEDLGQQARAQQRVSLALPDEYIVALNMAPSTPEWLRSIGAGPMTYGLDLSGGVHFLMEVDMNEALTKQLTDAVESMRNLLREERLRYRPPIEISQNNNIVIRFNDEETRRAAANAISDVFPELIQSTSAGASSFNLLYTVSEQSLLELQTYALQQNLTTLRTRVDELGVREPRVQRSGANRIIVELPGIQDTARAKDMISAVATLQFHLVATLGAAPGTTTTYEYQGMAVELENAIITGGENVTNAQSSFDPQTSLPQVNITLDANGARDMNEATRNNIGRQMAILLIETQTRTVTEVGPDGEVVTRSEPYDEVRVISVATIQAALGRQFRITGLEGKEANDLALLIRSGALAAPMYFLEERTIGPSLGQENIDKGMLSVQVGLILMALFLILYYRFMGFLATLALTTNLILLVALMSVIGATLTLPGIAGIVLTVAMAVDANVLIFSRIREELDVGVRVPQAIEAGFSRALTAILDSNITTLLVAIILYVIGTGPIKGFAVTLSLGLVTSVFSAVVVNRALVNLFYGGNKVDKISIGKDVLVLDESMSTAGTRAKTRLSE